MAVTDPRAVKFCNEKIRPTADLLACAYYTAKALMQAWNAQGMAALIPNTAPLVQDGASNNGTDATGGDGRPLMKGTDANAIVTRAQDLINWMEGATAISAGNGSLAVLNTVLAVKVNGTARF